MQIKIILILYFANTVEQTRTSEAIGTAKTNHISKAKWNAHLPGLVGQRQVTSSRRKTVFKVWNSSAISRLASRNYSKQLLSSKSACSIFQSKSTRAWKATKWYSLPGQALECTPLRRWPQFMTEKKVGKTPYAVEAFAKLVQTSYLLERRVVEMQARTYVDLARARDTPYFSIMV